VVTEPVIRVVGLDDVEANRRRGGDLRILLSPKTVGSTSGLLGMAILEPGERVAEHYHPYSEEFLFVVSGTVAVDLDGVAQRLDSDSGLMVPIRLPHRVRNVGTTQARIVFHLSPLAPRPELGHVDTEPIEVPAGKGGGGG
jgi:putative monooxygenase